MPITRVPITQEQKEKRLTDIGIKLYTSYLLANIIDHYYSDITSNLKMLGEDMRFETKQLFNRFTKNVKEARTLAKQITETAYKKDYTSHFVTSSDDITEVISMFLEKTGNDQARVEKVKNAIKRFKDVV